MAIWNLISAFLHSVIPIAGTSVADGQQEEWPLLFSVELESQCPSIDIKTQHALGGPGDEQAYDIWPTPDGGYVVTGSITDAGAQTPDLFLLKLDANGIPLWNRRVGGDGIDMGFAVRVRADGAIFVAGWTHSEGAGRGDFQLLAYTGDGEQLFARTFGGPEEERATALHLDPGGEALILGESYGTTDGSGSFMAVRVDADGNPLWERRYNGGDFHERGLAIVPMEGGYLLVGNSMDSRSGSRAIRSDGYAIRISRDGDPLWAKQFGNAGHNILHHAVPTSDGALLSGYSRGIGEPGETDLWFVAIDESGEVLEERRWGSSSEDHHIVARPADDGVALVGYSRSGGSGDWNAHVGLADTRGRPAWQLVLGGEGDDGATAVIANRNQWTFVGYTTREATGRDILFGQIQAPETISDCRLDSANP